MRAPQTHDGIVADALRAEMRASVPAPFNPDRVADRLIARGMHLREAPKPDADYYDTLPTVASIDSMAPHAPVTTSERDEAALGGNPLLTMLFIAVLCVVMVLA